MNHIYKFQELLQIFLAWSYQKIQSASLKDDEALNLSKK